MVPDLDDAEAAALHRALEDQTDGSGFINADTDRWPLAQHLLGRLAARA